MRLSLALLLFVTLSGCGLLKKKDADAGADTGPAASASTDATPSATADEDAAPPTAAVDPNWLPGYGYEDTKARKEIGRASYKSELDGLEKEINSEK